MADVHRVSVEPSAYVSPTGRIHAVRPGQERTACGLDSTRTRRHMPSSGRSNWTRLTASFGQQRERSDLGLCANCLYCLTHEIGPGARRS